MPFIHSLSHYLSLSNYLSLSLSLGCSFSPATLATAIRAHIPSFTIAYRSDALRQSIANSWPRSLDDSLARRDWGWEPTYTLDKLVEGIGEGERESERGVLSDVRVLHSDATKYQKDERLKNAHTPRRPNKTTRGALFFRILSLSLSLFLSFSPLLSTQSSGISLQCRGGRRRGRGRGRGSGCSRCIDLCKKVGHLFTGLHSVLGGGRRNDSHFHVHIVYLLLHHLLQCTQR